MLDSDDVIVVVDVPCPHCSTMREENVNLTYFSKKDFQIFRMARCEGAGGCQNEFAVHIKFAPIVETSFLNWGGK